MINEPTINNLIFDCEDCGNKHTIGFDKDDDLIFMHSKEILLLLNKAEAHLLMLYLQEHLK